MKCPNCNERLHQVYTTDNSGYTQIDSYYWCPIEKKMFKIKYEVQT